jgi:hypothetical protein
MLGHSSESAQQVFEDCPAKFARDTNAISPHSSQLQTGVHVSASAGRGFSYPLGL